MTDYSERVEYALTKAQTNPEVEHVEVFLGANLLLTIRAAVRKILENKIIQDAGVGIRILTKDHGLGFASTSELSDHGILTSIEEAIALARYRKMDPDYAFPTPQETSRRNQYHDPHLIETIHSYQDLNAQINQMLQETGEFHPAITEIGGPTHLLHFHKHVMNSNGVDISESGTYWTMEILTAATSPTDRREGSASAAGWRISDLNPTSLAQHTADIAVKTLDGKAVTPGAYEVILSPTSVANFLHWLTELTIPHNQERHLPLLKNKIGDQIAANLVTIGNDPLKVPCKVSGAYDDEGIPTQNLTLIKNGIFQNMPFDTFYGHQFETGSNGNGYRTGGGTTGMTRYPGQLYQSEPLPELPAIYMEGGDATTEEMIAETKKGIYLDFLHYGNITNGDTGDYAGILRQGTFWIENGEIQYPIQKCRLIDNIIEMTQNIDMISSSKMAGHWGTMMRVPSIKIAQVQITPY